MKRKPLDFRKGFTLIEMVMVLVIIGILATIVVPQFTAQMDEAKTAQTKANLASLRSALIIYNRRAGNYPTSLNDLTTAGAAGEEPILQTVPTADGWGTPFIVYLSPTSGVVSCNPDINLKCHSDW